MHCSFLLTKTNQLGKFILYLGFSCTNKKKFFQLNNQRSLLFIIAILNIKLRNILF